MLIKLPAVFGDKTKIIILTDNGITISLQDKYIEIKTQYKYEEPVDEDDETLGRKETIEDAQIFTLKRDISQTGWAYDSAYGVYYVSLKVKDYSMFINTVDKATAIELYTTLKNWLYSDIV